METYWKYNINSVLLKTTELDGIFLHAFFLQTYFAHVTIEFHFKFGALFCLGIMASHVYNTLVRERIFPFYPVMDENNTETPGPGGTSIGEHYIRVSI